MSCIDTMHPNATASRASLLNDSRLSLRHLISIWLFRYQSRRELANLNSWELADIGVDPIDAVREARKPFWVA